MAPPIQKIVYVEDEPDIQAIAQMALESIGGFKVILCSSGKEALDIIPAEKPDLILMDVMMPEMDGPSTLAALRQNPICQDIPVAFMTAKVQKSEIDEFVQLGAIGVIPKPFDPMTLSDEVRGLWAKAHGN
ncbi:response regulator [Hahella ganghwensis]|uniref:response regulator n=1 Tax=Hahella ganghwensis TaxID=286420 RepID=UPI000379AEA0|nr:response regulator [Hahella ganghwensis]